MIGVWMGWCVCVACDTAWWGWNVSLCMRRLRKEGKNVFGEDGQFEQQQWKMPEVVQDERSVR